MVSPNKQFEFSADVSKQTTLALCINCGHKDKDVKYALLKHPEMLRFKYFEYLNYVMNN